MVRQRAGNAVKIQECWMTCVDSERKKLCIGTRKVGAGVLWDWEQGHGCYMLACEARKHPDIALLWEAKG